MSIAELRKLPATEKLKIIEALWSDLVADEEGIASPAWHEEVLRATEADFVAGRVETMDWEQAKKEYASVLNEGPHTSPRPTFGSSRTKLLYFVSLIVATIRNGFASNSRRRANERLGADAGEMARPVRMPEPWAPSHSGRARALALW